MKINPILSIIIPVYNEKNYINSCLLSLFNQRYDKRLYQVVIIDNNSIDTTIHEIKKNFSQFINKNLKIIKESKQGIDFARETGFRYSLDSKYLITIDADTIVPPDFIQQFMNEFNTGADAIAVGFVFSWFTFAGYSKKTYEYIHSSILRVNKIWKFFNRYFGNTFEGSCYGITSKMYKKVGGISDMDSPLKYNDDIILSKKIIYQGGSIHNLNINVTISSRRLKKNLFSFLSGELYWGDSKETINTKVVKEKLNKKIYQGIIKKQNEIYTNVFIYQIINLLIFVRNNGYTDKINKIIYKLDTFLPNVDSIIKEDKLQIRDWKKIYTKISTLFGKNIYKKLEGIHINDKK